MANDRYCEFCQTDLDHPSHSPNCPAYDGPPPESEGVLELRERVNVICEALTLLVESLVYDGDKKREVLKKLAEARGAP
jgi:hypothetical protein